MFYKSKQGLFCTNCMERSHTKRQCRYLNGRSNWARNQMRTIRSYYKQGGLEKPYRRLISILSGGSNSAFRSSPQSKEVSEDNHLDTILPDDLLVKVFSFLPATSVIRATAVCRRWYEAVRAGKHDSWIDTRAQKPWYYMFDYCSRLSDSNSYDPDSQIWYKLLCPFTLLRHVNSISSSHGLLCFFDLANYRVFVHNPITKETKQLPKLENQGLHIHHRALSLSVNRRFPHSYTVAAVKFHHNDYSYACFEVTIEIYESESKMWVTRVTEYLPGWDGYHECVICDKVLYCMIHSRYVDNPRLGLIMHDLSMSDKASTGLLSTLTLLPTWLRWARLINVNDRAIVVGGNHKNCLQHRISIWELHERSIWEEIDRLPIEFIGRLFPCFQNYKCCGADGLVYIHGSKNPDLLTYDMATKQWGWTTKFPVPKESVNHSLCGIGFKPKEHVNRLFSGFCFEPRPEVSP